MAKIPTTLDFLSNTKPDKVWQQMRRIYELVAMVVNGKVTVGAGGYFPNLPNPAPGVNLDLVKISATTAGGGVADFILTHNLGRLPEGFIVIDKSNTFDVWSGTAVWTTTTISLRATVNGETIVILVF